MRVAVISDTHLERPSSWFEKVFTLHLEGADALIHCGDITGPSTYHYLLAHKNPLIVAGNMDAHWAGRHPPAMLAAELEGFSIGISHGWGGKSGVGARVAEAFGPGFDLICYGHTHVAALDTIGAAKLLNPGSLETYYGEPSLAFVTLTRGGGIEVSFHTIDNDAALV